MFLGTIKKQALFPYNVKGLKPELGFSANKTSPMDDTTDELIEIFARTTDRNKMEVLFREIFTANEINTLSLRWQLLKDLYEGKTQRKIAAEHKISLCKITRGSKILKTRGSYLKKILDELYQSRKPS
ncbi:hypothetical protein DSCOOX_62070 [Desulfosarcina ovata subsp. ovata]|uniref:Transcriptional regulator n=2 Tax=Desulfosarcina ovata TaxID=83564 RepID=A0A5K8AJY2_9BACT|nr:hypothetical protein DSCOOX_62070 [Desulfosarcina ovata subsp. ovata]